MGTSARGLHPSFGLTRDKYWYWNRSYDESLDLGVNLKLAFYFNDPANLGATHLHVKIGPNRAEWFQFRYTGRLYARDGARAEVEAYARRFPYAELIIGLDRNGGTLPNAKRIRLK